MAQNTNQSRLVKQIVSDRQKKFKKNKNKDGSCESLINETKKALGQPINVRDLNPLQDSLWNIYLKCPQTDWESVIERSAIELYKNQLMAGINKLNIKIPKNIIWSPINCPCFDAHAYPLGLRLSALKDFWLIEINNSIDINIGEYAKIAALSTPIEEENNQIVVNSNSDAYLEVIRKNNSILAHFLNRLVGHMLNKPAFESSSIPISQPHLTLYAQYSQYAQIFTIAHELSHAILNHNMVNKGLVISENGNLSELEAVSFSDGLINQEGYKQEYEADSLGLEIMLAVIDANTSNAKVGEEGIVTKKFGVYGAEMLLTWVELFQNAEIVTYGTYSGASSHPPGSERRKRIRQILQRKSIIDNKADFGMSTYKTMSIMWEGVKTEWINSLAPKIRILKKSINCQLSN